ncbi:MAG: SDR family oxidoreductase [Actinomycetota bacterium]|nr:SDR family oxidoreductase [Actinomycetota bacterium]
MTVSFDLTGRTALITGAGQGVGAGIAATLAAAGAKVYVNDLVPARAAAAADELIAVGGAAEPLAFDVTDHEAVVGALQRVGGVDILVNNAGNAGGDGWPGMVPFVQTAPSEWAPFLQVNLFGVMHCVHSALPYMIERRWGRIITIMSDAGRVGEPNMAAYAAAKAGAAALTRSVAHEVGRYGITANNIALGTMRTPLSEARWATITPEESKVVLQRYLVRRPGNPDDVAGLALFLASGAGEWVTAQTYPVNGGYSVAL